MPNLLAINTTTTHCAVAVAKNGTITARQSAEQRQAAQQILPMLQQLLQETGVHLAQLDAIVVVAGPGSFTGMRIGIGVAQGLGLANNTAVIPLSSLAVMARQVRLEHSIDLENWLIAMPARDQEIYLGAYRLAASGAVASLHREWVGAPEQLRAQLQPLGVGEWGAAGPAWQEQAPLEAGLGVRVRTYFPDIDGSIEAVCMLGAERLRDDEFVSAEQALPNYVKEQMDYS